MRYVFGLIGGLIVALSFASRAEASDQHWLALSDNAKRITGDITVSVVDEQYNKGLPVGVAFQNGAQLKLQLDATMPGFKGEGGTVTAWIYRASGLDNARMLNGESLCSGKKVAWVAYWFETGPKPGDARAALAFFSNAGQSEPVATSIASHCATFYYSYGK